MDLYRLSNNFQDLLPLNLDRVFGSCISLIEWPSRLGSRIPDERLTITIRVASDEEHEGDDDDDEDDDDVDTTTRIMAIVPYGSKWEKRILTLVEAGFLDDLLITP